MHSNKSWDKRGERSTSGTHPSHCSPLCSRPRLWHLSQPLVCRFPGCTKPLCVPLNWPITAWGREGTEASVALQRPCTDKMPYTSKREPAALKFGDKAKWSFGRVQMSAVMTRQRRESAKPNPSLCSIFIFKIVRHALCSDGWHTWKATMDPAGTKCVH